MPPPLACAQLAQRLRAPRPVRCAARRARPGGHAASEQQSCPRAATGRRRLHRAAQSAAQRRQCEHRRLGAPRRPRSRRAPAGARALQQHASHARRPCSGSVAPSRARLRGRGRSPPRARPRSPQPRCRGRRRRQLAPGTSRAARAASCELRGHTRSERRAGTQAEGREGQGVGGCGRAYRRRYGELIRQAHGARPGQQPACGRERWVSLTGSQQGARAAYRRCAAKGGSVRARGGRRLWRTVVVWRAIAEPLTPQRRRHLDAAARLALCRSSR
jgi:hypothetical protein